MTTWKTANLALRFLLELVAFASLGFWGGTAPVGAAARAALVIALPSVAVVFWGMFVAPRARVMLATSVRMTLGLLVFMCAAAALADRGHGWLGFAFAALAILNAALMLAWRQDRIIPRGAA